MQIKKYTNLGLSNEKQVIYVENIISNMDAKMSGKGPTFKRYLATIIYIFEKKNGRIQEERATNAGFISFFVFRHFWQQVTKISRHF